MKSNFVELVLTCGSWQEAQKITDGLLEAKLITRAEFLKAAESVKVIIQTLEDDFEKVEAEIRKHHGYKAVLQQLPTVKLNAESVARLEEIA